MSVLSRSPICSLRPLTCPVDESILNAPPMLPALDNEYVSALAAGHNGDVAGDAVQSGSTATSATAAPAPSFSGVSTGEFSGMYLVESEITGGSLTSFTLKSSVSESVDGLFLLRFESKA